MYPAQQTFYRGKAAMRISLQPPKEEEVKSGSTSKSFKKTIPGVMFLEIAPSIGTRKYDWEKKIVMAVSAGELAKIEAGRLMKQEISLFHDPGMNTSSAGQCTKSLKIASLGEGKYAFNMYEKNGGNSSKVSIVLDAGEMYLFKTLTNAAIPKLYAWAS